jgi:hypothetical protein
MRLMSVRTKVLLPVKIVPAVLIVLLIASTSAAAPIQQMQGVIVDLEHDHLWLKPDRQSEAVKFILKWNVRFNPPRLPLKGDRVQILYKNKEEGSVIYGLNYIKDFSNSSEQRWESDRDDK